MEIALYRKYRPGKFADVRGQDAIVSLLQSVAKSDTVAHAYLFVGSRGTGKTSLARIFAREIGASEKDLYEIDGASHNGVDEIRELREAVRTLPFDSEYKVYIIDEVHMLSKAAFNAFLKTLEEPPKHAIFILATTELHKIPDTIISRCQKIDFKKPSLDVLTDVVQSVGKEEGYAIEKDAARIISILGDGSFRDTLGVLQLLISATTEKKITRALVESQLGAPQEQLVRDYILSLLSGDTEKGFAVTKAMADQGIDTKLFTKLVMHTVRMIMLSRYAPSVLDAYAGEISADERKEIEQLSKEHKQVPFSEILSQLIDTYHQIDDSYISELPLEILLAQRSKS